MKRRMTFPACILLTLCLFPGMAAAEENTQVAKSAQGCDDLSFLAAAPALSTPATPAMTPLAAADPARRACCFGKRAACEAVCVCGVFEFNCDPATCQSNCICNICP
jgi:hypothetical protein